MDLVHEKTYSAVIPRDLPLERHLDRGGTTVKSVAQGELVCAIFVGVMQFTTQAVIERRRDSNRRRDLVTTLSRRHPPDGRQWCGVLTIAAGCGATYRIPAIGRIPGHGTGRFFGDRDWRCPGGYACPPVKLVRRARFARNH